MIRRKRLMKVCRGQVQSLTGNTGGSFSPGLSRAKSQRRRPQRHLLEGLHTAEHLQAPGTETKRVLLEPGRRRGKQAQKEILAASQ